MSIRTEEDLHDRLSADLIWRKKELTVLRFLLSSATNERRGALLRGSLTLAYAHWEGYVKAAGNAYLEFLHFRRLAYSQLAPNFIALAARSLFRKSGASSKIKEHLELTEFFLRRLGEQSRFPYKDGIDTGANLSSTLLREIVESLGLDFGPFETKTHLIDNRLLRQRNTIAHGDYLLLDEKSVDEVISEVLKMLETIRTQIDNAVSLARYRREHVGSTTAPPHAGGLA